MKKQSRYRYLTDFCGTGAPPHRFVTAAFRRFQIRPILHSANQLSAGCIGRSGSVAIMQLSRADWLNAILGTQQTDHAKPQHQPVRQMGAKYRKIRKRVGGKTTNISFLILSSFPRNPNRFASKQTHLANISQMDPSPQEPARSQDVGHILIAVVV